MPFDIFIKCRKVWNDHFTRTLLNVEYTNAYMFNDVNFLETFASICKKQGAYKTSGRGRIVDLAC